MHRTCCILALVWGAFVDPCSALGQADPSHRMDLVWHTATNECRIGELFVDGRLACYVALSASDTKTIAHSLVGTSDHTVALDANGGNMFLVIHNGTDEQAYPRLVLKGPMEADDRPFLNIGGAANRSLTTISNGQRGTDRLRELVHTSDPCQLSVWDWTTGDTFIFRMKNEKLAAGPAETFVARRSPFLLGKLRGSGFDADIEQKEWLLSNGGTFDSIRLEQDPKSGSKNLFPSGVAAVRIAVDNATHIVPDADSDDDCKLNLLLLSRESASDEQLRTVSKLICPMGKQNGTFLLRISPMAAAVSRVSISVTEKSHTIESIDLRACRPRPETVWQVGRKPVRIRLEQPTGSISFRPASDPLVNQVNSPKQRVRWSVLAGYQHDHAVTVMFVGSDSKLIRAKDGVGLPLDAGVGDQVRGDVSVSLSPVSQLSSYAVAIRWSRPWEVGLDRVRELCQDGPLKEKPSIVAELKSVGLANEYMDLPSKVVRVWKAVYDALDPDQQKLLKKDVQIPTADGTELNLIDGDGALNVRAALDHLDVVVIALIKQSTTESNDEITRLRQKIVDRQ